MEMFRSEIFVTKDLESLCPEFYDEFVNLDKNILVCRDLTDVMDYLEGIWCSSSGIESFIGANFVHPEYSSRIDLLLPGIVTTTLATLYVDNISRLAFVSKKGKFEGKCVKISKGGEA